MGTVKSFPGGLQYDWEGLANVPKLVKTVGGRKPDENGDAAVSVTDRGKRPNRLMVSFMDDDCRAEVVSKLENLIDQKGIPYTLACAPGDMIDPNKAGRFITPDDLKRMVSKGVTVSCHAYKQYNMDEFDAEDAFREDLEKCQNQFQEWGIPVETMSYPQGRTVDAYMPAVREHYRAGFTVKDGINQIPYASYYMNRVGLFENDAADDGTASLANAKTWVNKLATKESGWLVFMTHAWYAGFNPTLLGELIDYIRSKDIEIVDIHEALDTAGNIIEVGTFKKPSEDLTEPFFVVDAAGVAHTNALTEYARKLYELIEMQVPCRPVEGNWFLHGEKGTPLSHDTDTNRRLSTDIKVNPGEVYRVACSSVWNGAAYAVLATDGTVVDIKAGTANTPYTIVNKDITIPEGGAILRLSSNVKEGIQPGGYKIYKVENVVVDAPVVDVPTLDAPGSNVSYVLPIGGENLGGVKNGGNVVINEDGTMDAHLGLAGAAVGQIARITEVDEAGVPTAWEAVDEPKTPHIGENGNWWIGDTDTGVSAGGSNYKWKLINNIEVSDVVDSVKISEDLDGNTFSARHLLVFADLPKYELDGSTGTGYATYKINNSALTTNGYYYPAGGWDDGKFYFDIIPMGNAVQVQCYQNAQYPANGLSSGQPAKFFHTIVSQSGEWNTVTSFEWSLYSRKVLPGSKFAVFGEVE